MKQIQTIIALTLLCTTANAQNIQGSYQPKADGQVSKQQVAYTATDTIGQGLVWDLSEPISIRKMMSPKIFCIIVSECEGK